MKKYLSVISLVFLLCFVVGCQDKAAMAELEQFRAQAALEEQNINIVSRYVDGLNKGNSAVFEELCASEYAFYHPSVTPEPMSREEVIETHKAIHSAFPDVNWIVKEISATGDKVILWNVFTGTHEGEFMGIPATGNKINASSIVIYSIQNGKIIEEREENDMLGLMQQFGMELKPKEEEK